MSKNKGLHGPARPGWVLCTLLGAALVQSLSSASSFVNPDSAVHLSVLGALTFLAVTFFSLARRRRRRGLMTTTG